MEMKNKAVRNLKDDAESLFWIFKTIGIIAQSHHQKQTS